MRRGRMIGVKGMRRMRGGERKGGEEVLEQENEVVSEEQLHLSLSL